MTIPIASPTSSSGFPRAEALVAFRSSCNHGRHWLWITESWFPRREGALVELLSALSFEATLRRDALETIRTRLVAALVARRQRGEDRRSSSSSSGRRSSNELTADDEGVP